MAETAWIESIAIRKAVQLNSFRPPLESGDEAPDIAAQIADPAANDLVGQTWHFSYCNAAGDASERQVTIRSIGLSKTGAPTIAGFCHLRRTLRSFRCDRISAMTSLKTGEVIEDVSTFLSVTCGLTTTEKVASDGTKEVLTKCRDGLRALLFLAWSDGELHEEEIEAMLLYADRRAGRIDYDVVEIRKFIEMQDPDADLFARGLRRIASSASHLREFLRAAEKVLIADGEITPEETMGMIDLTEALDNNDGATPAAVVAAIDTLIVSFSIDETGSVVGAI